MIKEAVATGATIEEAQQAAVLALDAPVSADVQFEVLSMPEKKVLGIFGGKQAEVRAFYEAPDEKPAKKEKPVKKNDSKKAPKSEKSAEKAEKVEEPKVEETPAEVIELSACPENVKKAYDYLQTLISGIGVEGTSVEISRCEKDYFFKIMSEEDYSLLIGRRGETLDSIQYLVRLVANKSKNDREFSKISINIGNYREKREATLKDIARRTAGKVKKYGRNIALDPMNPFERRIIHTEVAKIPDVTSYSVGSDADRKVVIALEEGAKPTNPRKSYGNNRGGGRGNRDSRESQRVEAPQRAPRSDAEGIRYGKIMPKAAEAETEE